MELETSVLVGVEVLDYLPAVAPELRVEDPVCDLDTGQDGDDVEGLPGGVLILVHCKLPAIFSKLFPNF